ncbi:hypothetical protein HMPREF9065_00921 [Aggregatibacter sp. oral taxon 458 str. W10330]|nr:hypothetical protein HMPREF9065_00921 [Aggregatibacter sp. oral taxon 458 str. W10330]
MYLNPLPILQSYKINATYISLSCFYEIDDRVCLFIDFFYRTLYSEPLFCEGNLC